MLNYIKNCLTCGIWWIWLLEGEDEIWVSGRRKALVIFQNCYAPPSGTMIAARRYIRVLGSCVLVYIGDWGINLHHME